MTNISRSDIDNRWIDIIRYCPICREHLEVVKNIDIMCLQFRCTDGHSFYSPISSVYTKDTGIEYKYLHCDENDIINASMQWLSDVRYRMHIGNELAAILRILLESVIGGVTPKSNEQNFKYCVICGEYLSSVKDQMLSEIYEITYCCSNQHKYYCRKGIRFNFDTVAIELYKDLDVNHTKELARKYIEDKFLSKFVPDQLKSILLHFIDNVAGEDVSKE